MNNEKIMKETKNKILKLIYDNHINIFKLSEATDITDSSIRNWYSERDCSPSFESICKICEYFGLSLSQFFVTEDESLFPVDDKSKELLETYLSLNEEDKKLVIDFISRLKGK